MQKIILSAALALLAGTGHTETYDSGLLAAQAAAAALANTGATPTRMCSNKRPDKDATRVMMEGQTESGIVALEVVKQGAVWKVRDAKNPQGWPDSACKVFTNPIIAHEVP
jgi:hypothetical protein